MRRLAHVIAVSFAFLSPSAAQAQSMWSGGPNYTEAVDTLDRVPREFRDMVEIASQDTGFSVALIDALIRAESGYDPMAVSEKGAQGLVQIMPETAKELKLDDAFDAEANLKAGLHYLQAQLDAFGSLPLALAAYNAGPSAVTRHQGMPPYPETRAYVFNILASAELLINPPRSQWRGAIGSAHSASFSFAPSTSTSAPAGKRSSSTKGDIS